MGPDSFKGVLISEIVECIRDGQCPFCKEEYSTVYGVINHIRSSHPIGRHCPVCNADTKIITLHMSKMNDLVHKIVYAIYFDNKRSKKLRNLRKELFG